MTATTAMVLILIVGAVLRLNGLDWDDGHGFHPDERSLYMRADCMYRVLSESLGYTNCLQDFPKTLSGIPDVKTFFNSETSPLNPHWFPLGSLLIYVLVGIRYILEIFGDFTALDMRYVGRSLSAFADIASIGMIYILGRRMFDVRVGIIAALFMSFSVIHIQNSHFYRPETFSVLFVLLVFWAMFRLLDHKRYVDSMMLGSLVGLALSPKVNVFLIVLPVVVLYVICFLKKPHVVLFVRDSGSLIRLVSHLLVAATVGFIVFALLNPYAILDVSTYYSDITAQSGMAKQAGLWPFTVQYIGTYPFLYQLKQSIVWGLGIPLGIISWSGLFFSIFLLFRSRNWNVADVLLIVWLVPSVIFLETFEVHFLRYIFYLIPFLVLLGSRMCVSFWDSSLAMSLVARRSGPDVGIQLYRPKYILRRHVHSMVCLFICISVIMTALHAIAFQSIYLTPHTAVQASEWLQNNVKPGTKIISDNHWDEFIPNMHRFSLWQFPVYDPDNKDKMSTLASHLSESEYLVFYSYRPFVSALRGNARYQYSARYYELLFSGDLGYWPVKTFLSYPTIAKISLRDDPYSGVGLKDPTLHDAADWGVDVNLGYADDNVVGYDHPQVLVFQNIDEIPGPMLDVLLSSTPNPGIDLSDEQLLMSNEISEIQRSGGTWADRFDASNFVLSFSWLFWFLTVELIYVLTLPISILAFRALPDKGIVLGRCLGLLLVAYLTWIGVNLGWFTYGRESIVVCLLGLTLVSLVLISRRFQYIRDFVRSHWKVLISSEALFILAFFGFLIIRILNPDIWHPFRGGEKPMDLAYLNAVARSSVFPPYDPWFSGGFMNYYYWGYLIISVPLLITGITPLIGFNLAVPLLFALTATGAYSIGYNLAHSVSKYSGHSASRSSTKGRKVIETISFKGPMLAGLSALMFVVVLGNLDGFIQISTNIYSALFNPNVTNIGFDFWRSSRMIPEIVSIKPSGLKFWIPQNMKNVSDISYHITEFPFFSFLFADLHAHMMSIPFSILTLGSALNLFLSVGRSGPVRIGFATLLLSLCLGSIWVTNSWDYPTYILLITLLVLIAVYMTGWSIFAKLSTFILCVGSVLIFSVLLFWPFWKSYQTFGASLAPSAWNTPISSFLSIHGLFIVIAIWFFAHKMLDELHRVRSNVGRNRLLIVVKEKLTPRMVVPLAVLSIGGLISLCFLAIIGYYTASLTVVLITLSLIWIWILMNRGDSGDKSLAFVLLLLTVAAGIGYGVEFVRFNDDIGRMNTVFKFYLQAWVLYGIATSFMLWHLMKDGFYYKKYDWIGRAALVIVGAVIGSCLIYTFAGTSSRISDRFDVVYKGLDGSRYMETAIHVENDVPLELRWDREAILWLQSNVSGTPNILEAHNEQYHWSGRISSNTGLPTILGWPWHQMQQRNDSIPDVLLRSDAVSDIYNTTNQLYAKQLLDEYSVEYIVVGGLEKAYYSADGLGKFSEMVSREFLTLPFDSDHVQIYRMSR